MTNKEMTQKSRIQSPNIKTDDVSYYWFLIYWNPLYEIFISLKTTIIWDIFNSVVILIEKLAQKKHFFINQCIQSIESLKNNFKLILIII
jgi:hypothetical protein